MEIELQIFLKIKQSWKQRFPNNQTLQKSQDGMNLLPEPVMILFFWSNYFQIQHQAILKTMKFFQNDVQLKMKGTELKSSQARFPPGND